LRLRTDLFSREQAFANPFGAQVNDLALTLVVAGSTEGGYDPVELALRLEQHLLGPIVPGWANDDILKVLVDSHDIKLVRTPDAAIPKMLE